MGTDAQPAHAPTRPACAIIALLTLLPSFAYAQPRWLVVAASSGRIDEARRAVPAIEQGLSERGLSVLDSSSGSALFESQYSSAPITVPSELLASLGTTAETVLERVALGDTAAALQLSDATLARSREELVALGRLPQARDLANICLYAARAELQQGRELEARRRLRDCLRSAPRLEVDRRTNPAEIEQLLEMVAGEIENASSVLSIQTIGFEDRECDIRLQGRVIGRTPSARIAVAPGTYGVQIECSPEVLGRVHWVDVPESPVRVEIAAGLDQTVDTSGSIGLHADANDARVPELVASLGHSLDAQRVLLSSDDGSSLTLVAYTVGTGARARELARTSLARPFDDSQLDSALAQVSRPDLVGTRESHDEGLASLGIVGLTLGGVGVAAGVASVILGFASQDNYDRLVRLCPEERCSADDAQSLIDDGQTLQIAAIALTAVAGAALATGIVLLAVDLSDGQSTDNVSLRLRPTAIEIEGTF